MVNIKEVFNFDLTMGDIKRIRATLGIMIMIGVYVAFMYAGFVLSKQEMPLILLTIFLIGLGQLYGAIGVLIQLILKTKPEDIPVLKTE